MARIQRTATSKTYRDMKAEAGLHNETNDCVVKAIVATTGESYAKVHKLCSEYGRINRKGTSMGRIAKPVLRDLGYKIIVWGYDSHYWADGTLSGIIRSYPGGHSKAYQKITTHHPVRFAKQWSFAKGKSFIALTTRWRHALAIVDGEVHDWTVGRANRIDEMWEIVKV